MGSLGSGQTVEAFGNNFHMEDVDVVKLRASATV